MPAIPSRTPPAVSSPTSMGSRWAGARSSRAATTGDGPEQSRPWEGRDEDKFDDRVWAATCFFIRRGFRKGGVSRELARAAAGFARDRGARAIEGYPITTTNVIMEELLVGTESVFAEAGLSVVSRPTLRRVVMRLDF
jgi:GNAT superfamily N-acetyltransferase